MVRIKVVPLAGAPNYKFEVTVTERRNDFTTHVVTMAQADFSRYAQTRSAFVSPEHVIETAFEFLLEQEPKESIMANFDITVISHFFPDFERTLVGRL